MGGRGRGLLGSKARGPKEDRAIGRNGRGSTELEDFQAQALGSGMEKNCLRMLISIFKHSKVTTRISTQLSSRSLGFKYSLCHLLVMLSCEMLHFSHLQFSHLQSGENIISEL